MSTSNQSERTYKRPDGIVAIRSLHPVTKQPVATEAELEAAFNTLQASLKRFYDNHPVEAMEREAKARRTHSYPSYDPRCNVLESITIEK